ncbi:MAG: hypothetical protein IPF65_03280 [Polaromonas sp.]|nr:hypothetical protein [Polaromonas sp.]
MFASSVERLPPYSTFRNTSMRDMVSQFKKLPLHRPELVVPHLYQFNVGSLGTGVAVPMLTGVNLFDE